MSLINGQRRKKNKINSFVNNFIDNNAAFRTAIGRIEVCDFGAGQRAIGKDLLDGIQPYIRQSSTVCQLNWLPIILHVCFAHDTSIPRINKQVNFI